MGKVALTHTIRDKSRKANLKNTFPSYKKRRVMGRRRRTLEIGVSLTKSPGKTLMNFS
jgi:hypothetical protein